MPLRIPDKPFVGVIGKENTLEVVHKPDWLICRVTSKSYWFNQTVLLVFGSGLSWAVWVMWHNPAAKMPLAWTVLVWLLTFFCWAIFVRNLFGTPRAEVSLATTEIRLFRWNTQKPWRTIQRDDINHFAIDRQYYIYDSRQAENYVLYLVLREGRRLPLCASTDETLIRSLVDDLVKIIGRNLQTL